MGINFNALILVLIAPMSLAMHYASAAESSDQAEVERETLMVDLDFSLFTKTAHVNKGLGAGLSVGRIAPDERFMSFARMEYNGSSDSLSPGHDWAMSFAVLVQAVKSVYVGGLVGSTLNNYSTMAGHTSLVIRLERAEKGIFRGGDFRQSSFTELDLGGLSSSAPYWALRIGLRFF